MPAISYMIIDKITDEILKELMDVLMSCYLIELCIEIIFLKFI